MGSGINGDERDLRKDEIEKPPGVVKIYKLTGEGESGYNKILKILEKTGLPNEELHVLMKPDYMKLISDLDSGKEIIIKPDDSKAPSVYFKDVMTKETLNYFAAIKTFYDYGFIEIKLTDKAKKAIGDIAEVLEDQTPQE